MAPLPSCSWDGVAVPSGPGKPERWSGFHCIQSRGTRCGIYGRASLSELPPPPGHGAKRRGLKGDQKGLGRDGPLPGRAAAQMQARVQLEPGQVRRPARCKLSAAENTRHSPDAGVDAEPFAPYNGKLGDGETTDEEFAAGPNLPLESSQPDRYHFYNVLWVETIDDVMYRKVAGRVPKEIWEQNGREPRKIVLG